MRLDYTLLHIVNNYKGEDGFSHYDYVGSTIWFSKQELCDEVSEFLGIDIPLETKVNVTREQMESVWKLLDGRKDLIGMYGDDFLNDW
jgi:hypothetical protein